MPLTAKYDSPLVAQRYHRNRYMDFQGRLNLLAMRRALGRASASIPVGGRLLDVPCGTGQYSWTLAAAGFRVIAADSSPEMLKVAATLLQLPAPYPPHFQVEDVFRLSFPAQSFEAAICIRFFNLVDRAGRIAALRELARVARTVIASYSQPYTLKQMSRLLRYWCGLRSRPKARLSRSNVIDETSEAGLVVRKWISVAPLLSEVHLAVMTA